YSDNREFGIRVEVTALSRVYKEGFFILAFNMSKFAYGGFTRITIFHQLGDEKLGIFSTAWQFVPLSTLFFAQVTRTWRLTITQCIKHGDRAAFRKQICSLVITVFAPTLLATTVILLYGGEVIHLVFNDQYAAASELMPFIALYFLVIALDTVSVLLAVALSLSRVVAVAYATFGVVTVLACLVVAELKSLNLLLVTIIAGHFLAASVTAALSLVKLRTAFR
ncbi:hypothetical protein OG2516_18815, partial [Oceanicola granulosus HTCC2516]